MDMAPIESKSAALTDGQRSVGAGNAERQRFGICQT